MRKLTVVAVMMLLLMGWVVSPPGYAAGDGQGDLYYYESSSLGGAYQTSGNYAIRFTPEHKPERIETVSFALRSPSLYGGSLQYAIFDATTDAQGKPAYHLLVAPTDVTAPSTAGKIVWMTIDVSSEELVVDGDFVVAVVINGPRLCFDGQTAGQYLTFSVQGGNFVISPTVSTGRIPGIMAHVSYVPEITSPADGAHVSASNTAVDVLGTTVSGAKVNIYRNGVLASDPENPLVADGLGNFAASVSLDSGLNVITAETCFADGHTIQSAAISVTRDAELTSISVEPGKTHYWVGEDFDLDGLAVTGHYSDGTTKPITGFDVSPFDKNQIGTQDITVTYQGLTATFTVEVKEVALESIAITAQPARKIYCVGEQLDLTGLEVTAFYNDGTSTVLLPGDFSISPFDSTKPCISQNITVEYGGQRATFAVRVMAISHNGKLAYDRGTPYSWCQISAPYGFAVRFTPDHAPARIDSVSFMLVPTATGGDFQYAIFSVAPGAGGGTVYKPLTGPINATASSESDAWTTIDVSGYNLMVDGDFIVAKITSSATNDPAIRLDQYSTATDSHRNLGYTCDASHVWFDSIDGSQKNTGNLMIRADLSYEPTLPEIIAPVGGAHVTTPSVEVTGAAPADAEVRLYRDCGAAQPDLLASVQSSDDGTGSGTFAATVELGEGDNTIWAAVCYPDGHSDPSARVTATLVFDHISVTPAKTEYWVGDTIAPSDLTVEGCYGDGTTRKLSGFTISGFDSGKPATGQVVTVTYEQKSPSYTAAYSATFTVEVREMIYTIAPLDAQTFATLTAGYTAGSLETKTVTITRTGNRDLANLAVSLGGDHAADFVITQPLATTLTNGAPSTTFTIAAKSGLAAGTHVATVMVSATNLIPVNVTITQVVDRSPDDDEEPPRPVTSDTGSAVVNPATGGTISLGEDVVAAIPANALAGSASVSVSIEKVTAPLAPSGFEVLGGFYELTVGGQQHYTFAHPITLTFTFDPSKLQPGDTPSVRYFDETSGQWVDLGGVIAGNTITVTVDHFTRFAVMASAAPPVVPNDIAGHWAENAIKRLVATGATVGYPDGSFRPDNSITRAEFVTMLVRGLKLEAKIGSQFADCRGHWAESYITTAARSGIAGGYDANTFGPNDLINREQMIAMIARAMRLAPASGTVSFSDQALVSGWAVDCVRSATAAGVISGYSDGTLRPLANATRAEAATMLANALK